MTGSTRTISLRFVYTMLFAGLVLPAMAETPAPAPAATPAGKAKVLRLKPVIVKRIPHDKEAFTQGLLLHEGVLYESTGLYGKSSLRRVDPTTGDVIQDLTVDPKIFAEGLALVDDKLIQITWKEKIALVYDAKSLEQVQQYAYEGEGWGLCHGGNHLYMSDGTHVLTVRDPKTFEVLSTVPVLVEGKPLVYLNELEYVDGSLYANIWQQDVIAKIDPTTGNVEAFVIATDLLTKEERRQADVLNGIAYDPATKHFLITGKNWPAMFEVTFAEAQQ